MRISHSMSFQLMHLLEDTHLEYKIKTIKKIADIVANLRSFVATGEGDYELGEYEIDNNLQWTVWFTLLSADVLYSKLPLY